jgi:predicted metal-dependent hydrolase
LTRSRGSSINRIAGGWSTDQAADRAFAQGLAHLRAQQHYDAHEELENAWRVAPPEERAFLQGLVHVAVAWHHALHGNRGGCERQLEKAARRLAPCAPAHRGVDVASLLLQIEAARGRVAAGDLSLAPVRV